MKRTSLSAYNRVGEFKIAHHIKILKAIARLTTGKNYEAIARRAGLDKTAVARRNPELVELGYLKATGDTSKTSSGHPATNYLITRKGIKYIKAA